MSLSDLTEPFMRSILLGQLLVLSECKETYLHASLKQVLINSIKLKAIQFSKALLTSHAMASNLQDLELVFF